MPPVLTGFFVLVASLAGWPAVKQVPLPHFHHEEAPQAVYRAWSSPRWDGVTEGSTCRITFFAVASRRVEIVTDRIFVHDTALTVTREVKADYRVTKHFGFFDLKTGELLADREVSFTCYGLPGSSIEPANLEGTQ